MELIADLEKELRRATVAGFRYRLLAQGLARGLIWRNGKVPADGPKFSDELTDDLLEYGYSLLFLSLRYKTLKGFDELAHKSLLTAAEALESASRRGGIEDPERGLHLISAAVAFHAARYSARAYCMVSEQLQSLNLSKLETSLSHLIRRSLGQLRLHSETTLGAPESQDETLASLLSSEEASDQSIDQVISQVVELGNLKAISYFEFALKTGAKGSFDKALETLSDALELAAESSNVSQWWGCVLTRELIEGIWEQNLHSIMPLSEQDELWTILRRRFISMVYMREKAEIDLWPSQISAARRSYDSSDDLVVTLPTSAGKTRIAEICILRTLSQGRRVIYVTPLRALSAQTERILTNTFRPLGYSVSSLYGAAGASLLDLDSLKNRSIVVATPEKLDFALRYDATLLNDVGLVVLDEGHMIGLGEREIRYEILIQRLLRRSDSKERRIVCLSAILPTGEELKSFVSWLRSDEEGEPVQSDWRPNRIKFGTLSWLGTHVRADFLDQEKPFIEHFLDSSAPKKPRKNPFPQNKNELVLGSAWKLAEEGQRVLIYCPLKKSVEPLGNLAKKLAKQGYLRPVVEKSELLNRALSIGAEWLGPDHVALECLKLGLALHHGSLPRPFLSAVEELINEKVCKVVIASPTLAQGLNLSASALIVHSLYRNKAHIPSEEFANVIGRAGRAFVDIEGLVLYPVFESSPKLTLKKSSEWKQYVEDLGTRSVTSGLLKLVGALIETLRGRLGESDSGILEFVANSGDWKLPENDAPNSESLEDEEEESEQSDSAESTWEFHLALLDNAILSLLENTDVATDVLATKLDEVLIGSLWSRQIENYAREHWDTYTTLLRSRAQWIWKSTTSVERGSYFKAGVGVSTGKALSDDDEIKFELEESLAAYNEEAHEICIEHLVKFAKKAFLVAPFKPHQICENIEAVIEGWLLGKPMADLIEIGGAKTVGFVQDALIYKLVWAMEAVRTLLIGESETEEENLLTVAVECGSLAPSVCLLVQAGLQSRMAAQAAVADEEGQFTTRQQMWAWLASDEIRERTAEGDWPTPETSPEWTRFYYSETSRDRSTCEEFTWDLGVVWNKDIDVPSRGSAVRIKQIGPVGLVCSECFDVLGALDKWQVLPEAANYWGTVTNESTITVSYMGPRIRAL